MRKLTGILLILLIVMGVVLYLEWKEVRDIRKKNQELREEIRNQKEYIDLQTGDYLEYKAEVDRKTEERDREIRRSEERIELLEKEKSSVIKERDEYKKGVESAGSNYIVEEIGERIGIGNVRFTASGKYELTREGANRVLFRMKDGEASEENYQKQIVISEEAERKYEKEHETRLEKEELLRKSEELVEEMGKQIANQERMIGGLEKELAAKKRASLLEKGIAGGVGFLLGTVLN